jgi:hypothetical protein
MLNIYLTVISCLKNNLDRKIVLGEQYFIWCCHAQLSNFLNSVTNSVDQLGRDISQAVDGSPLVVRKIDHKTLVF